MGNNVLWLSNHFHVNSSFSPLFCFYNCNHTINLIRKPFEWWPSGEIHSLRSQLCLSTHCRQKSPLSIVDETWNKIEMMPSPVKFTVQILKLLISRVLVNSFFFCHALDCTKISLKWCPVSNPSSMCAEKNQWSHHHHIFFSSWPNSLSNFSSSTQSVSLSSLLHLFVLTSAESSWTVIFIHLLPS